VVSGLIINSSFQIVYSGMRVLLCILLLLVSPVQAVNSSFGLTFHEILYYIDPYLIPPDHEIKPILDKIFYHPETCFNFKTLKAAGFSCTKPRKHTRLIIAKHALLPNYIFKLYLDIQDYHGDKPEYHFWILRIRGAEKIREAIHNRCLDRLFKVPKKWIYLLPQSNYSRGQEYYPKLSILVEEDMNIFSDEENRALWKGNTVTPLLLLELHGLIKEAGLNDCLKPDNVPFSTDGRIAFIDTQSFGAKQIPYKKLARHLSEQNKVYWDEIIHGKCAIIRN
jgi:hypothetical protein